MKNYKGLLVNAFTIVRLIGIPFVFIIENKYILAVFAATLFMTDFIDGFLARKWSCTSRLGALLDLIADKSLVLAVLIVGVIDQSISILLLIIVATREIASMIIRQIKLKKENKLIEAKWLGKFKTTLQFVGLVMMLLQIPGYRIVLWVMIVVSYASFYGYFKTFIGKDLDE